MPRRVVESYSLADDAALLEDRDDLFAEAAPLGGIGDVVVDAVEGAGVEPAGDLVGDGGRGARERGGLGGRDGLDRLPEREIAVAGELGDVLGVGAEAALGVLQRLLRERGVEVVLAEVVPGERAAELGQGLIEVLGGELELALDLARVGVGVADVDPHAGHHHHVVGVAALGGGAGLDVGVERLALLERGGVGEDALADRRAEVAALLGVARLEDHRLALRRPGDVERARDLEVLAPVVERVLPGRVEERPGRPVARERVRLVGIPQALRDPDELQPARVPGVVVEVLIAAEVGRRPGVAAGDDVPAGPSAADQVQAGQAAGHVERVVVGRGHGRDQAQVPGGHGEGRQQRHRLEPVEVVRRRVGGDELAVDDEDEVELGRLGQPGLLDVPVHVDAGVARDLRV